MGAGAEVAVVAAGFQVAQLNQLLLHALYLGARVVAAQGGVAFRHQGHLRRRGGGHHGRRHGGEGRRGAWRGGGQVVQRLGHRGVGGFRLQGGAGAAGGRDGSWRSLRALIPEDIDQYRDQENDQQAEDEDLLLCPGHGAVVCHSCLLFSSVSGASEGAFR